MIPTKDKTLHIPLTPEEIAEDTYKAYRLGASVVHLHARDEQGKPTHKKERFEEIIKLIKKRART